MKDEYTPGYVPRAPRFKVANSEDLTVTFKRTVDNKVEEYEAELLDVSQHGTKLRVPVNLRFEEALQLDIKVKTNDIHYQGVASVRHIRAEDDEEKWVVGCAVAPPISDEAFSFLATTAGKERRRFRRLSIAAEGTVRKQTETEGSPATLHNLSSGGFCFSSPASFESGESVQLMINDLEGKQRVIGAKICWQLDDQDGTIAGCQFVSRESYADLCACLTEQPGTVGSSKKTEAPTSKLVLTAAILAMFLPPMLTLALQSTKVSAKGQQQVPVTSSNNAAKTDSLTAKSANPDEAESTSSDKPSLNPSLSGTEEAIPQPPQPLAKRIESISPKVTKFRIWVDNTGKHKTEARLLSATDEAIELEKPGGRKIKVPWNRLCEEDQQFVRDWQVQ